MCTQTFKSDLQIVSNVVSYKVDASIKVYTETDEINVENVGSLRLTNSQAQ